MGTERIVLNPGLDLPLLVRVRNSTFISSQQLYMFAVRSGIARTKGNFFWRVGRLERSGLIQTVPRKVGKYRVYRISKDGLRELEHHHMFLSSLRSDARRVVRENEVPHALILNDLRDKFEVDFGAEIWRTDLEVRAVRLESGKFVKNYDAIAQIPRVNASGPPIVVGVEFERLCKAAHRYRDIAKILRQEDSISMLLYLTASGRMIPTIAREMENCRLPVAFTTVQKLLKEGSNSAVFMWVEKRLQAFSLQYLLERMA